jgi:hypothetical protein
LPFSPRPTLKHSLGSAAMSFFMADDGVVNVVDRLKSTVD